ncbi:hemerythrin domain-containing protein [Thermomonospora umbrina]|uniref:Hemerythrin HHE cation binding domain-containing protein n=1 Tax=Thermomonospora umbrina TaxID=111806 RepID=A0A3D9SFP2_9ACTN|nr:hemerythrin domain-containing protein [Thermomonospora umbrina]REE94722.1 hemerythrin HHE cation binding domain-containing protein [Thermomonospora umbrina]
MTRPQTMTETDVIDLLVHQHAMIRDLFAEVLEHSGDARKESFQKLVRLLAVHETAEEEIVHPTARRSLPGGEGMVDDRLQEEREAKEMLAELDGMDVHDPRFMPGLDRLRLAVLTHARAEERYEFDRLRDEFSDAQRRAMARAVKAAEATAPTHPHPGTESATANLTVGPLAAMVDRVRDIIRKD